MATVAALAPEKPEPFAAFLEACLLPESGGFRGESVPANDAFTFERSSYSPPRVSLPAVIASAVMITGMIGALATLNMTGKHEKRSHLTVMAVRELNMTPAPPPPEPTRLDERRPAVVERTTPKPMIELPSAGPAQVMVDAPPPPPQPIPVVAVRESAGPTAPAGHSASPAAGPLEAGDLSGRVISAKPPVYPVDARRAREQGVVKLLVLVGSDGQVKDIDVASSSGSSRLDSAALKAVRRWRWAPMVTNGVATAVRGYVTIPFVLTNA